MNIKFADKVFRMVFVFVFVAGTVWMPNQNAKAQILVSNPRFTAHLNSSGNEQVHAYDWTVGSVLNLTIEDPSTMLFPDFTKTLTVSEDSMLDGETWTVFELNGFDLQAGQEISLTDGTTTKSHVIRNLGVTSVDSNTEIVRGTADPLSIVNIVITADEVARTFVMRGVSADDQGNWVADFSIPGTQSNEVPFDIHSGTWGSVNQVDLDLDNTSFGWQAYVPRMDVGVSNDFICAHDWPEGSNLTLTIDDSENGIGIDLNRSKVVSPWTDYPSEFAACFDLRGQFNIKPGDEIKITGGGFTKMHVTRNLTITAAASSTDTVSGFADTGAEVKVWAKVGTDYIFRSETADSNGLWDANYGISGDTSGEQVTLDLQPNMEGHARIEDVDGDATQENWIVPEPPNFHVRPNENEIHAFRWPEGNLVHVTVDDPATPNPVDYEETQEAVMTEWFNDMTFMIFRVEGMTLQTGQIVTMTDGTTTKTHVIQELSVTGANPVTDIVEGSAAPNAFVHVWESCDQDICAFRYIQADNNGAWLADFSVPGSDSSPEEQKTLDLQPGSNGNANIRDEDGDFTTWNWRVPNSFIIVRPEDDSVFGFNWTVGTLLNLEIDDPETTQTPDYTASQVFVESNYWENGFELDGIFDIQSGHLVTVSDGTITRRHIVTHLAVTNIDIDADTVSGTGYPDAKIHVDVGCTNTGCVIRYINVDENGNWLADFSIPVTGHDDEGRVFNIRPGSSFGVYEYDEDDDATHISRSVPNPTIGVRANYDQVDTYIWDMGDTLTLKIDNPTTIDNPDYTATKTVTDVADWDPSQTYVPFDLSSVYDIQTGDVVSISNGAITKETIVTNLAITDVHLDTDIVEGIAEPNQTINMWTCWQNTCVNRDETADQDGNWTTNFAIPGEQDWEQDTLDIRPGSWIDSSVEDEDRDNTMFGWSEPNLTFVARANYDQIEAWAWPMGDTLSLSIDDPDSLDNPDYTTTQVVTGTSEGDPRTYVLFDLSALYDIQIGDTVSIGNGTFTKTTIVTNLAITNVYPGTDIVEGAAEPNQIINVWTCWQNTCVNRDETADQSGHWTANFAIPGEKDWEQGTLDIRSGSWIDSSVEDEDGDSTMFGWNVSSAPIADAGPDQTALEADTVTLDASASSDPESGLLTYEWDLDADGEYDDATGVTTNKIFPDNGNFTVGIKVTNQYDESDTDTAEITVANISPTVAIQQASANNLGILTGSGLFTDPGADTWTASVNYGDGTVTQSFALNPDKSFSLSHTYSASGDYTIEACVSDDDGGSGCDQIQVTVVTNQPPVADAGGPYSGNEGTTINLSASKSTDPDNSIVLYEWDFDNDGQFDDASGIKPKFRAIDNGIFTISVQVTDAGGLSSVDSARVTVKNVPPIITSLSFNRLVRVGVNINARATFKDAGVIDTFTAIWKWGDGKTSNGVVSGTTVNGSHIYTKPGIYLVTITVKDKDDGIGQAYKLIVVLPKK